MSSSDDTDDGSTSSSSKDLLEPTQDELAATSVGSSVGWNPDGDGSPEPEHDVANNSLQSTASTAVSRSRKRKRSQSSSLGWNPDGDGDSAAADGSEEDEKPSQLPSQIDIGGPSIDAPKPTDDGENDDHSDNKKVARLDTATPNRLHTKPPERIRYIMLGAPTLLYRHAPSYLDPSVRPSALTPQQLSMALYMNRHPIKGWFRDEQLSLSRDARKYKPKSTKNPLLNSTNVPQHPRPWGRPHDWDWGHTNAELSESKALRDLKRQAELDAYNMTNELHDANRVKVRRLWEDIEQRNKSEIPKDDRDQSQRFLTGFNVFCSEYIDQMKHSTVASSHTDGPQHHFAKAMQAWNELSGEEQTSYEKKAGTLNQQTSAKQDDSQTVEGTEDAKPKKRSRKGRTTGFNIFRSEYMQSHTVPATDTGGSRKNHLLQMSKKAGAVWKEMTEEETSVYKEKANVENAIRSDPSSPAKSDRGKSKTIARLRKEDGVESIVPAQKPKKQQNNKSKQNQRSKKQSRKGQTTGFNTFRVEYMQSNSDIAGASGTDGRCHLSKATKVAGQVWKDMSEEDKHAYNEKAQLENDMLADFSNLAETGDTEEDSEGKTTEEQPSKGGLTGYHVFLSEYRTRWKESNPNASSADRKLSMFKCQEGARADWKDLSANERSGYKERAKSKNKRNKYLTSRPKTRGREGIQTGFNVFRSENMKRLKELDPLPKGATAKEREAHFKRLTDQNSQQWKKMTQAEKDRYKQDAERGVTLVGRKGKVNGFNIFQSKYTNQFKESNSLHEDATAKEKKAYFKRLSKQTSQQWSGMPEDEKSLYKQDAVRRNSEMSPIRSAVGTEEGDDDRSISSSSLDDDSSRDDKSHGNDAPTNSACDPPRIANPDISSSLEERQMCPEYFAPFGVRDTGFGFHLNGNMNNPFDSLENGKSLTKQGEPDSEDDVSHETKEHITEPEVAKVEKAGGGLLQTEEPSFGETDSQICEDLSKDRHGVGGPSGYGNCLLATTCKCLHCGQQSPSWFLIHPNGENMSSIAVSKLKLPCDSASVGRYKMQAVNIGDRILQISQCGATSSHLKSAVQVIRLVVRTSQFCSVVQAKSTEKMPLNQDECSVEFCLQEETRIDLRAPLGSIQPSYLPVYSTCDPKSTVSYFASPSFAILSSDYSGNCSTIHRVSLKKESNVKVHSMATSLADISLIEFDPNDRMALWAAARSHTLPKLSAGFFKARSGAVAGYGHSLFRIDLRNDSAAFVWSPSHAEYVTETLHSISGIMADASREDLVWIASSSACKVWALDVRYKAAKVVVSWSLPSLCNDFSLQVPITGVFGGGVLMSQPLSLSNAVNSTQSPTLFSLNKNPNCHAVDVLQFPSGMPRLQTKPLESAGFQEVSKLKYNNASVARSAIFPLPDVSSNLFNIGLAALECPSTTVLKQKHLYRLGYNIPPANVTYIITMTSLGDMYCHSILATNATEETHAHQFAELPVGMKAVSIPGKVEKKPPIGPGCLRITLSNEYPVPSSAISPFHIADANKCSEFKSFDVARLAAKVARNSTVTDTGESLDPVQACKIPRTLHGLTQSNLFMKSELNLLRGVNVQRFKVAHRDTEEYTSNCTGDDADEKIPFQHSLAKFELEMKSNHFPLNLPASHMQVVANKLEDTKEYDTDDASNTFDDGPSMELGLDLLKRLQSQYLKEDNDDNKTNAA